MSLPITALLGIGKGLIEKLIPDPKARAEAELKLLQLQQEGRLRDVEASMKVIVAEAQSESWVTRSWRPILMLSITAVFVNNYILFPYLSIFTDAATILTLPDEMWTLLHIGVGGYIGGRTVEKVAKGVSVNIGKQQPSDELDHKAGP